MYTPRGDVAPVVGHALQEAVVVEVDRPAEAQGLVSALGSLAREYCFLC